MVKEAPERQNRVKNGLSKTLDVGRFLDFSREERSQSEVVKSER